MEQDLQGGERPFLSFSNTRKRTTASIHTHMQAEVWLLSPLATGQSTRNVCVKEREKESQGEREGERARKRERVE